MDDAFQDKRFKHLASDPRFRKVPRSERKVKIDQRFKAMFTDDRFKLKYTVDKRGRPVSQTQADNLKKYYELSSGEEGSDDDIDDEQKENDNEDDSSEEEAEKPQVVKKSPTTERKVKENQDEKVEEESSDDEEEEEHKPRLKKSLISERKVNKKQAKGKVTDVKADEKQSEEFDDEQEKDSETEVEDEDDEKGFMPQIADEDRSLEEESDADQPQTSAALLKKEELRMRSKLVDQAHRERMKGEESERLKDMTMDYARGIGLLGSDESSSDESSSEDSEDENLVHPWGELDRDADRTEEVTSRLAACHLDWDRITAKDLFILFTSFLPPEGFVKSVVIYPSEFGLERMKEEELKGPKELVEEPKLHEFDDDEFKDKHADGAQFAMEKLREYQLNRLKYYYAVISFDGAETANKVYTECDGTEYESSATKLDLRFIPEDMEFDQEPKDSCDSLPDVTKYKPRLFVNTALQQGTVRLTWDETDPNRVEFTRKVAGGGDVNDDDMQAFVAAPTDSSGEEENDGEEEASADEGKESSAAVKTDDPIAKYKALLSSVAETKKRKSNVDMEVSWGVGLGDDDSGDEIGPGSGSEDDVKKTEKDGKKNGKLKKWDKKGNKLHAKDNDNNEENAELQLLLADDAGEETSKAHFNFKDIQKEEKRKNKKRKHQKGKKGVEDNFEIDVNDSRFSALYTSHHFNIDPADSRFVKTSAAEKIIQEKQKRRKLNDSEGPVVKSSSNKQKMNPELASLVKSIKGKRSGT